LIIVFSLFFFNPPRRLREDLLSKADVSTPAEIVDRD
jgi:hypothetical protein